MNTFRSYLSSSDFRSTAIARVCLAVAKTNFGAARQSRNRRKTKRVDLNQSPWVFLSLTARQARRRCVLLQSP